MEQIINEITYLKKKYVNNYNTYEINYLNITEKTFSEILKKLFHQKWDNVEIIDNKEYIQQGLILGIDTTGNMECISRKILKYKLLNNVRINLFNERKISTINFEGSDKYDKVYKQKKMIFSKNNFNIELIIKINSDKITTYEFKIHFKSIEDEQYLLKINDYF